MRNSAHSYAMGHDTDPHPAAPRILSVPEIVAAWDTIRPMLESVAHRGRYWTTPAGECFQRFHAGHWVLWALGEPVRAICAVGVAKEYDGSLSLRLELVAGEADWHAELAPIAAWGRERGCVRICMPRARKGWARVFRDTFKVNALFLEAPIS
jgi:hypothetical protein